MSPARWRRLVDGTRLSSTCPDIHVMNQVLVSSLQYNYPARSFLQPAVPSLSDAQQVQKLREKLAEVDVTAGLLWSPRTAARVLSTRPSSFDLRTFSMLCLEKTSLLKSFQSRIHSQTSMTTSATPLRETHTLDKLCTVLMLLYCRCI